MTKKNKGNWLERQAATLLDRESYERFITECRVRKKPKSKLAHEKLMKYYEGKSPQERANLNRLFEEMTEEQRKNPKK